MNRAIIKIREFLRPHLKRISNESNLVFQNDDHAITFMITTPMIITLMVDHGYHTHVMATTFIITFMPGILYTLHQNGKLLNHTLLGYDSVVWV